MDDSATRSFKNPAEMMYSILGKDEYCTVIEFFLSFIGFCVKHKRVNKRAKHKPSYFVVFMTRRCHVLKMIFFSTLLSDTFQEQLQKNWFNFNETGLTKEDLSQTSICCQRTMRLRSTMGRTALCRTS